MVDPTGDFRPRRDFSRFTLLAWFFDFLRDSFGRDGYISGKKPLEFQENHPQNLEPIENLKRPRKKTKFFRMSMIRTYTILVQAGRLVLLTTLVGFFVVLVVVPLFWGAERSASVSLNNYRIGILDNRLHQARYLSSHEDSAYEVGAEHAENLDDNRVSLSNLASTLKGKERDMRLVSMNGLYDRGQENLFLEKDVQLTTTDGYVVKAPSATVDLKTKNLSGQAGVTVEGPLGSLKAPQFTVKNNGEEIVLTGRSSLVITSK